LLISLAAASIALAACGGPAGEALRIYTSVTQETVDAVVDGYRAAHPGVEVEVFRAPTGELTARIAAEQREGGLQADVLWLSDPLSVAAYDAQGLLLHWEPDGAGALEPVATASTWWATRVLTMVVVHDPELPAPEDWWDLASGRYPGGVALPDPGFAGSALGALGFFALDPGYGFDFYAALAETGATQVPSPGEVVAGVAEGRFDAGMTLEFSARSALDKGSPIAIARPAPGAIGIASPVAVVAGSAGEAPARDFVEHVLSVDGQQAIAATGWRPARPDVEWDRSGGIVFPDWGEIAGRRDELLDTYSVVFGG
jgi:iron(III) transport system substrate-binding protein